MISSSYTFKNIKNRNPISFRLQIVHNKWMKYIYKRDFENLFFLFKKFFKNCIIKLLKGGF